MTDGDGIKKIPEYYGLKTSYIFDPKHTKAHREFMAPRMLTDTESLENHMNFFETDLMTDQTPKRIYVGDYGNGKTHLLLHISERLRSQSFEYCHVDCPALSNSSTPIVLFREFLNELGGKSRVIDLIISAFIKCRKEAHDADPEKYLESPDDVMAPYLEKVFSYNDELTDYARLVTGKKEQHAPKFWVWLTGGPPDASITATNLSKSPPDVLRAFKTMLSVYEKAEGKKLLIVFDELDKADNLGKNASEHWKELFRQLCDPIQTHAGILMAVSPKTYKGETVIDGNIENRIGGLNVIKLTKMSESVDIKKFVKEIVNWNRSPELDVQKRIDEFKSEIDGEDVTVSSYPFSNEALDELGDVFSDSVPRDILQAVNRACALAQKDGKHFVTRDEVSKVKPDDVTDVSSGDEE